MRFTLAALAIFLVCAAPGARNRAFASTVYTVRTRVAGSPVPPRAAPFPAPVTVSAPPGLHIEASPTVVDVGGDVRLRILARAWPAAASAQTSFLSPHHGFSGTMKWNAACACFEVTVAIARRVHGLELARVTGRVRYRGRYFLLFTRFQVRGLARDGIHFAPGGQRVLSGWVSDPNPLPNEYQHYCAWVKTVDGLGVGGISAQFAVTYARRHETWTAGPTAADGVICVHRKLGHPQVGHPVYVDIWAAGMHTRVSFVPRAQL